MIRVSIKGFMIDSATEMPVVLLKNDQSGSLIPLLIGPFEAGAIILELKGIKPPRPVTHDLLAEMFKRNRIHMEYLEIYDSFEDIFFARIKYRKGIKSYTLEARPGDGLALSIRLNSPIYVNERIVLKLKQDVSAGRISDVNGLIPENQFLYLDNDQYMEHLM
ncbi:MAG: bifunctional nuclease family protein [Spirochaetes bacterium]|nr:bifunctional nuclease family protein [Spirochaetota bacterium]